MTFLLKLVRLYLHFGTLTLLTMTSVQLQIDLYTGLYGAFCCMFGIYSAVYIFWQCDARQQFKHNFERLTMAILSLWFFTFVHSLEWCVPSEKNRKDVSLLSVCGQNEVVVSTSFRRKGSGHVITYVICSPNYF